MIAIITLSLRYRTCIRNGDCDRSSGNMKVEVKKVTIKSISIKEALEVSFKIVNIPPEDLASLFKHRNLDFQLSISCSQAQLSEEE